LIPRPFCGVLPKRPKRPKPEPEVRTLVQLRLPGNLVNPCHLGERHLKCRHLQQAATEVSLQGLCKLCRYNRKHRIRLPGSLSPERLVERAALQARRMLQL